MSRSPSLAHSHRYEGHAQDDDVKLAMCPSVHMAWSAPETFHTIMARMKLWQSVLLIVCFFIKQGSAASGVL